jgi:hypothetical protein
MWRLMDSQKRIKTREQTYMDEEMMEESSKNSLNKLTYGKRSKC